MEKLSRLLNEQKVLRILDVGTGTGNFVSLITSCYDSFIELVGIDTILGAVKAASEQFMDDRIRFEVMDGTHMSFEDVGIMRNIPTMTIFEPVDGVQLAAMLPQIINHYGPMYIRLLRQDFDPIFADDQVFELGKATPIIEGSDISIFATGIMVKEAMDAQKILMEKGISASVINIHTVKPLDVEAIIKEAKKTKAVVTAENHNIINGLGSAVAEVLAENCPTVMERVGVKDQFGEVGDKAYLMERFGLKSHHIVDAALRVLDRKPKCCKGE